MTVATEIYATGLHPCSGKPVFVARTPEEKEEQRSFFFWYKPGLRDALLETLDRLGMDAVAERLLGVGQKKRPKPRVSRRGVRGGSVTSR
jgi:hypothetical protein